MSDALRNFLAKCIVSPRPNDEGFYSLTFDRCSKQWLEHMDVAIPAPPEPRTGTLGLSEAEVRALAGRSAPIGNTGLERVVCAAIVDAQQFVAEWDAADNAEPDTLTVTRDLAVEHVRYAANCWTRDAYLPDSPYIAFGDACRAALTEAGLK